MTVLIQDRFWKRVVVVKADECWLWTGSRHKVAKYGVRAYGCFTYKSAGKILWRQAHRLAYEFANGPVPEGLHILHSCDNPPCCNPAHLRPGTHLDNMRDAAARGRLTGKTSSTGAAALTPEAVRRLRVQLSEKTATVLGLARELGVSPKTIRSARSGANYAWVTV